MLQGLQRGSSLGGDERGGGSGGGGGAVPALGHQKAGLLQVGALGSLSTTRAGLGQSTAMSQGHLPPMSQGWVFLAATGAFAPETTRAQGQGQWLAPSQGCDALQAPVQAVCAQQLPKSSGAGLWIGDFPFSLQCQLSAVQPIGYKGLLITS